MSDTPGHVTLFIPVVPHGKLGQENQSEDGAGLVVDLTTAEEEMGGFVPENKRPEVADCEVPHEKTHKVLQAPDGPEGRARFIN